MKKGETQLAVKETGTGLAVADLNSQELPVLKDATVMPIDLSSEYWSPETIGEAKRLYFDCIAATRVKAIEADEMIELESAFFLEQVKEGNEIKVRRLNNGSKRLVGTIVANNIQRGTPLLITYMGKKKNKSNIFQSDNWSIKPLIIKL